MTNRFLHKEIREKGGAYGGRAVYNPTSGTFEMMSYRDPNMDRTVDVYKRAIDWAQTISSQLTLKDLDEAKLNIFQVKIHSKFIKLFTLEN